MGVKWLLSISSVDYQTGLSGDRGTPFAIFSRPDCTAIQKCVQKSSNKNEGETLKLSTGYIRGVCYAGSTGET